MRKSRRQILSRNQQSTFPTSHPLAREHKDHLRLSPATLKAVVPAELMVSDRPLGLGTKKQGWHKECLPWAVPAPQSKSSPGGKALGCNNNNQT